MTSKMIYDQDVATRSPAAAAASVVLSSASRKQTLDEQVYGDLVRSLCMDCDLL